MTSPSRSDGAPLVPPRARVVYILEPYVPLTARLRGALPAFVGLGLALAVARYLVAGVRSSPPGAVASVGALGVLFAVVPPLAWGAVLSLALTRPWHWLTPMATLAGVAVSVLTVFALDERFWWAAALVGLLGFLAVWVSSYGYGRWALGFAVAMSVANLAVQLVACF